MRVVRTQRVFQFERFNPPAVEAERLTKLLRRNKFDRPRLEEPGRGQSEFQPQGEVIRVVRRTRRRELGNHPRRNTLEARHSGHLLDQVDRPPQILPITRNLPDRGVALEGVIHVAGLDPAEPEPCEN